MMSEEQREYERLNLQNNLDVLRYLMQSSTQELKEELTNE